jgi:hypothetical protein
MTLDRHVHNAENFSIRVTPGGYPQRRTKVTSQ